MPVTSIVREYNTNNRSQSGKIYYTPTKRPIDITPIIDEYNRGIQQVKPLKRAPKSEYTGGARVYRGYSPITQVLLVVGLFMSVMLNVIFLFSKELLNPLDNTFLIAYGIINALVAYIATIAYNKIKFD